MRAKGMHLRIRERVIDLGIEGIPSECRCVSVDIRG